MSVVIVVPTFNERENVEELFHLIQHHLPESIVLFVDDDSPDGTSEVVSALKRLYPERLELLSRREKQGLGKAYVAGYQYALTRWPLATHFIQMDADLSHDPSYLPGMVAAAANAEVVVASRYVDGVSIVNWPLHRLIISKFGTAYARIVTGLPITDCTSGFKCYQRAVLERIGLETIRSNGYVFQVETSFRAWRLGFEVQDHPIIFRERKRGVSKLNLSIAVEAFLMILRLGFSRLFRVQRLVPVSAPDRLN